MGLGPLAKAVGGGGEGGVAPGVGVRVWGQVGGMGEEPVAVGGRRGELGVERHW